MESNKDSEQRWHANDRVAAPLNRSNLADLRVFMAIVRLGSFSKAAMELELTTSAVSHAMRKLEARLDVRLLNRTLRAVLPTPAGKILAERLESGFSEIEGALRELEDQRHFPIGRLRVNLPQDAAKLLISPVIARFSRDYPRVELDLAVEDKIVDIINDGYDAGIRYGERVPLDMVSVSLTPPLRWVVVGSPLLREIYQSLEEPHDLMKVPCIRTRLGDGSIYPWELGNGDEIMALNVQGPICLNETDARIDAAVRGVGFAYVLERLVEPHVRRGELEIVLPKWASVGPPLCMYYPSRRQPPPGLRQLIDMIRSANGMTPLIDTRNSTET